MPLLKVFRGWLAMRPRQSHRRTTRNLPAQLELLEARAMLSGAPSQFIDPHPEVSNQFGATVTALTNGNVVITSPNDDAGGGSTATNTGAGAVYLYHGRTGSLISKITGSHAGDQLGSGSSFITNSG